jgi:hypothetical protein
MASTEKTAVKRNTPGFTLTVIKRRAIGCPISSKHISFFESGRSDGAFGSIRLS